MALAKHILTKYMCNLLTSAISFTFNALINATMLLSITLNYCRLFMDFSLTRFLDDRLFATCSDDSTVALYDTRNLKTKIRTLRGHSNWVKNIEYSKRDCLLVTSGFDGSIFTWDLNSYTENNLTHQKVFHTPGELNSCIY